MFEETGMPGQFIRHRTLLALFLCMQLFFQGMQMVRADAPADLFASVGSKGFLRRTKDFNKQASFSPKVNSDVFNVGTHPGVIANPPNGIGRVGAPNSAATSQSAYADLLLSPFAGSDISHANSPSLLKCNNQTRCIQPYLQLQHKFKVYYCKHYKHGVRFFYLVREGLLHHPNVLLTDDMAEADVIVYLPESAPWHRTECTNPDYLYKTVVLDEGDHANLFEPPPPAAASQGRRAGADAPSPWLLYFKRSYVKRSDGKFKGYMPYLKTNGVLPMSYTIADAYVRPVFPQYTERTLDVVSTLRGGSHDPCRLRVREWTEEFCKSRSKACQVGQVNHASRTVVDRDYLGNMYRAKIIVTVNPSHWEGDFRLMEAMATGALVFVDNMHVHRPYPLTHGRHIVYYDNHNKTDLFDKLDFYLREGGQAQRVATGGYLHCMKYHRAVSLIDYVFRSLHLKLYKQQLKGGQNFAIVPPIEPPYTHTGFHIRNLCKEKEGDKGEGQA